MKINYIVKFLIRHIFMTSLFIVLIISSTTFLTISILMNYSSNKYLSKSKDAYTVIANIEEGIGVSKSNFPVFNSKYLKDYYCNYATLKGITPFLSTERLSLDGVLTMNDQEKIFLVEIMEINESRGIRVKIIETLYGVNSPEYINIDYIQLNNDMIGKQMFVDLFKGYNVEQNLNDLYSVRYFDVVTDINQETKLRDKYSIVAEYYDSFERMIDIYPINNLNAVRGFNLGSYFITDGTNFSSDDYIKGNDVCIISKEYAIKNGLKIGDQMDVSFEGISHWYSNIKSNSAINKESSNLTTKETKGSYRIKGIYEQTSKKNSSLTNYINPNTVFIPKKGLEKLTPLLGKYIEDFSSFILGGYNYTFEIVDGDSIVLFLQDIESNGLDLKTNKFTFYDQGYSKIVPIYKSISNSSRGLVITASCVTIIISIVLTYIYVTKRKKEIAVMRVLGIKSSKVFMSIILSVIITVFIGCILGNLLGTISYKKVVNKNYSNEISKLSAAESEGVLSISIEDIVDMRTVLTYSIIICLMTILFVFSISTIILKRIIKCEPIRLLS